MRVIECNNLKSAIKIESDKEETINKLIKQWQIKNQKKF